MTTIDIVILVLLAVGTLIGFTKGFIQQLASIAGFVIGLWAAGVLYGSLAERLYPVITESRTLAQVLSFLAIWIIIPLLFSLVASTLTKVAEALALGCINRWLGAALGFAKYALMISLLIHVIDYIDTDGRFTRQTNKEGSLLYTRMKEVTAPFFPAVEEATQQFII
ncbi:MAG: CvpA family protein [Bacteroides sp.]|nr:CvpA family protein [Bacteroides sp.]